MEKNTGRTFLENAQIPEDFGAFMEYGKEFEALIMRYKCAIREVQTKLEVLNDELSVKTNRNPISGIKSRIKKPVSILEKLKRQNCEISIESIYENLNDVAGIRVICSFIDDIYAVANMLAVQDDIKVIRVKDYIKNPKPGGYRSYHMIVEIPVFFSDGKQDIRVEVQIRTIAMDFWASLEHQLRYKKDVQNNEEIAYRLKECADNISSVDQEMQEIRKIMYPNGDVDR
ncbi:MAG: GTP pyrophosphokinase family protein [Lachnospiraceae bacterium]|nr:GTP pyrophosphokinase family protein [Lachnospiraceae bacterium]